MSQPENSRIGCLPLDSSFDFKYSNKHEAQQLCGANRPVSLNKCFKYSNKHEAQQLCGANRPVSLNKCFKNLQVKLFALKQRQIDFSMSKMSSSYSSVFWLSL